MQSQSRIFCIRFYIKHLSMYTVLYFFNLSRLHLVVKYRMELTYSTRGKNLCLPNTVYQHKCKKLTEEFITTIAMIMRTIRPDSHSLVLLPGSIGVHIVTILPDSSSLVLLPGSMGGQGDGVAPLGPLMDSLGVPGWRIKGQISCMHSLGRVLDGPTGTANFTLYSSLAPTQQRTYALQDSYFSQDWGVLMGSPHVTCRYFKIPMLHVSDFPPCCMSVLMKA